LDVGSDGELKISINSDGGDVYQGFAIYQALAMHPAKKTVTVMGLAASMASVVAMAGDTRIMPKNSVLMIHNPVGQIAGQSDEIISFGEAVGEMRQKIAQVYADASGGKLTVKAALALMDKQSWIGADEAKKLGLATKVTNPVQIAAKIVSRHANAPKWLGATQTKGYAMTKRTDDDANAFDFEGVDPAILKAHADDARKGLVAQQKEVRALCSLAGYGADVAADLNDKGLTVTEAMVELDKMKKAGKKPGASAQARGGDAEVSARHAVGTDGEPGKVIDLNPTKIWNRYNGTGEFAPNARRA
jgi:ATP-dependent Clp endopeptidase proteolytic subunit ClpP